MSVSIFTQSIEGTTLILTNGGADSDKEKLKWRDNRQKAINAVSGVSAIELEIEFSTSIEFYSVLFGNMYSTQSISTSLFYWNGTAYTQFDNESIPAQSNTNYLFFGASAESNIKFKIQFQRGSATPLEIGCIFISQNGQYYDFPVNYQQDNNRGYMHRYEKEFDVHGYGYSQIWNNTTKQIYDFGFHLTESQFTALKTQFEYFNFGAKRFFIKDTNVDANWHLAEWEGDAELTGDNISSGYYNIPFMAREV